MDGWLHTHTHTHIQMCVASNLYLITLSYLSVSVIYIEYDTKCQIDWNGQKRYKFVFFLF